MPDPLDFEGIQRPAHGFDRSRAIRRPRTQLGDHRIIKHRYLTALEHAGVVAHRRFTVWRVALPFLRGQQRTRRNLERWSIPGQAADRGQKTAIWVLGIEA